LPTVIDSLVIELGLDPSNLSKGQKDALAAFSNVRKQAESDGQAIEKAGDKAAESINKVARAALGLFAVLVGARGITDFVAGVTTSDAALGRLGQNLGMSAQDISAWDMAAQRMGGSVEATNATLSNASKILYDYRVNAKNIPIELQQLSARTGQNIDMVHGTEGLMLSVAKMAQSLGSADPNLTYFLLHGMGVDDATANAMIKYGAGFQQYLQGVSQYAPSPEQIKRMQDMQTQWVTLQQTANKLGTNLWTDFAPALKPFLEDFQRFGDYLITLQPTLKAFGDDAAGIATSLGGWRIAIDALIALWAGGKMVGMIGALRGLLGLGGATSVAGAAGAGAGGVGLGLWAVAAALGVDAIANTVKPAGAGEDALVRQLGLTRLPGSSSLDKIRQSAAAHGIDPSVAMSVARSEGLNNYVGDDSSSFGPFQLHYGGTSKQYPNRGLGDAFSKDTGFDARDPSTTNAQIDWVMAYVAKHGWDDWMGAAKSGITGMMGVKKLSSWWGPSVTASSASNVNNSNSSSIGVVNITVQGDNDPHTTAKKVVGLLDRSSQARAVNYGPS